MINLVDLLLLQPPFSFSDSEVIPPEPPIVNIGTFDSPYMGFNELLKEFSPSNVGYLFEQSQLPYISTNKISNTLDQKYSKLSRQEKGNYRISCYAEDLDELKQLVQKIEDSLDYKTFTLSSPRILTSLLWLGRSFAELYPGIQSCFINYELTVERRRLLDNLDIVLEGSTFFEALNLRYEKYLNYSFVSTAFQLENISLPYIVIPNYNFRELTRTSKSRYENGKFSFTIYTEDLDELENIQDKLTEVFDYCQLRINDKKFMVLEWIGDTALELYPGIWQGTIDYELMQEKEIVLV